MARMYLRSWSVASSQVGDEVDCSWVLYSPEDKKSTPESESLSMRTRYPHTTVPSGVFSSYASCAA
jgi:hypothetical protein